MSESKSGRGMALAGHDYVGQDQIWKDHVEQERGSLRNWERNWKFTTTKYKDLVADECPAGGRQPIPIPKHLRVEPAPPIHECVSVLPSNKPFPKTTASEIGYRSAEESLKLDKYGRYCRPKGGLVKQLKWPNEAIG